MLSKETAYKRNKIHQEHMPLAQMLQDRHLASMFKLKRPLKTASSSGKPSFQWNVQTTTEQVICAGSG